MGSDRWSTEICPLNVPVRWLVSLLYGKGHNDWGEAMLMTISVTMYTRLYYILPAVRTGRDTGKLGSLLSWNSSRRTFRYDFLREWSLWMPWFGAQGVTSKELSFKTITSVCYLKNNKWKCWWVFIFFLIYWCVFVVHGNGPHNDMLLQVPCSHLLLYLSVSLFPIPIISFLLMRRFRNLHKSVGRIRPQRCHWTWFPVYKAAPAIGSTPSSVGLSMLRWPGVLAAFSNTDKALDTNHLR